MKVLVTGSNGFIGAALVPALSGAGHEVLRLVRGPAGPGQAHWDIGAGQLDSDKLDGVEAVVHLAGVGIGERRWTEEVKASIQDSRIDGTRLLCEALVTMSRPPSVLVSGSAIGYYGDRGAEILDESSSPGKGFLAEVCVAWEAAANEARQSGIRVVNLRTGVVLGPGGGVLAKTLPLARLGMGGRLGSGSQYMSWVSLTDEVGAILHALANDSVTGPLNATAPNPVTNATFTATLAKVLNRPAPLPVPAFALSAALGKEMVTDMVLASQRVMPTRLQATGYEFAHSELEDALRAVTAKSGT
jgi:uncharacterized protein (TIGR01777 family)